MEENMIDIQEFADIMRLHEELITSSAKTILEELKDDGELIAFLNAVISLINYDSGFLFLSPSIIEKLRTIVNEKFFSIKDSKIKEIINEIKMALNRYDSNTSSIKELYRESYRAFQEEKRKIRFRNFTTFAKSLQFDYCTYYCLENSMIERIEKGKYPYALMSILYFIEICPGFFEKEEVLENTKELLEKIKKSKVPLSRGWSKAKRVSKLLNTITKKEE